MQTQVQREKQYLDFFTDIQSKKILFSAKEITSTVTEVNSINFMSDNNTVTRCRLVLTNIGNTFFLVENVVYEFLI